MIHNNFGKDSTYTEDPKRGGPGGKDNVSVLNTKN